MMIGKKVASEKPVPLAKVLETLEDRKKQGELGYEQRLAYDYAQKFARLTPEKEGKLISELLALGKIKERQAVILADLMPETKEDIELIFAKERTRLDEEDIKKVLELLGKYRE